jgi:hypothetical protein
MNCLAIKKIAKNENMKVPKNLGGGRTKNLLKKTREVFLHST